MSALVLTASVFGSQNTNDKLLKVYVDCYECWFDYIRTEITYVNYVRDPKQAEVHLLVSRQGTVTQGHEYTLMFLGRGRFKTRSDTLVFAVGKNDAEDHIRGEMVRVVKLGLMYYIARTPVSDQISIDYKKPASDERTKHDKWNNWVFTISVNGDLSGQQSSNSRDIWGSLSANRTTDLWKFVLSGNGSYDREKGEDYLTDKTTKQGEMDIVRSLSPKTSAGFFIDVFSSTFENLKYAVPFKLGYEYNIFPYSQSASRRLSFAYYALAEYRQYYARTIYDKWDEIIGQQEFKCKLVLVKPWGYVSTAVTGKNYLHDFSKNRVEVYGDLSFNIFKGFSFNIEGEISAIKDQISLSSQEASQAEMIAGHVEMPTDYFYWTSIGLSYSFGSIYNNIVNARF